MLAFTPWGEIAYTLAGLADYERVRRSDDRRDAPGADTLRSLSADDPALILLDELSVYLRKASEDAGGQLAAFFTSLFKAVESAPNAALVYTLAIGKGGRAADAYAAENQFVADRELWAVNLEALDVTRPETVEQFRASTRCTCASWRR